MAIASKKIVKAAMQSDGIYIGTSGWSYKGWAEVFYPSDLPVKGGYAHASHIRTH